jgi:hypothetical protein
LDIKAKWHEVVASALTSNAPSTPLIREQEVNINIMEPKIEISCISNSYDEEVFEQTGERFYKYKFSVNGKEFASEDNPLWARSDQEARETINDMIHQTHIKLDEGEGEA